MLHPLRSILCLLLLLCPAPVLRAQTFSYIYIQGDKKTPFYVKLEGEMQPRYGKNYCIVPELAPGPVNLEILFQQNVFPPQHFTVLIPEGGHRGFLINERNGVFSLFDLDQQFYLPAGNTANDDHLPPPPETAAPAPAIARNEPKESPVTTPAEKPVREKPVKTTTSGPVRDKTVTTARPVRKAPVKEKPARKADDEGPQFISGIELNRPGESGATMAKPPAGAASAPGATPTLSPEFRNSDCPEAMDDATFEQVYKTMMEKEGDEARTDYLFRQMDRCYKTWQARTLGSMLSADAARYSFLKKVYPRISDQASFPLLDDLLTSEVWKTEFRKLVHP